MLDHAHDHGLCRPGGDRHGVLVNIDVATLARVLGLEIDPTIPIGLGTQAFDAHTGAHLADHEVARFLCDADIQVLVHHNGVPLWMSNSTRTANRHQRRALRFRRRAPADASTRAAPRPATSTPTTSIYHCDDGATDLANLLLLCGHHHRALHRDEFTITTSGDQIFTFRDRWGSHLGTTTTSQRPGGPPPDIATTPHLDHPPDPPPEHQTRHPTLASPAASTSPPTRSTSTSPTSSRPDLARALDVLPAARMPDAADRVRP